jgi:hypothetical protein
MTTNKHGQATRLAIMGLLIAAVAWGAEVRLAWDPPVDVEGAVLPDLAGFRVCYGTQSGVYTTTLNVGMDLATSIPNLAPNTTYYIAVKAYAVSGVESDASEELAWAFDSDADGMPDSWVADCFGGVTADRTGRDDDFDGDGLSNIGEYVAGTDPTDSDDNGAIEIGLRDGQMVVSFRTVQAYGAGYAGMVRIYSLEQTADPTSGIWFVVPGCGAIPATGGTVEIPLGGSFAGRCFSRTRTRLE